MADPAPKLNDPNAPQSEEEAFRSALEDVVVVLDQLSANFENVDDLIDSLRLALRNDGHLRLLLNKVRKKRR